MVSVTDVTAAVPAWATVTTMRFPVVLTPGNAWVAVDTAPAFFDACWTKVGVAGPADLLKLPTCRFSPASASEYILFCAPLVE